MVPKRVAMLVFQKAELKVVMKADLTGVLMVVMMVVKKADLMVAMMAV
jgi:hypothetical protein